ncbi:hypothetical protein [Xanthomonas campestris]|uniref:hypothetical protein n=1 Tax=Xanthomonas campestris TaxID=339 RepID=UPI0025A2D171|nr:hypothetical protein [Xanthomonas campestris]MDM7674528.1 hypothetical protein [Xanthomonas campestris pv. campestris]
MHPETKEYLSRFQDNVWDVRVIAIINFIKYLAELMTVAAIIQYVGDKVDLPALQAAGFLLHICIGGYAANRIAFAFNGAVAHHFPAIANSVLLSLALQLPITIAVTFWSKHIIAGLILKEGMAK